MEVQFSAVTNHSTKPKNHMWMVSAVWHSTDVEEIHLCKDMYWPAQGVICLFHQNYGLCKPTFVLLSPWMSPVLIQDQHPVGIMRALLCLVISWGCKYRVWILSVTRQCGEAVFSKIFFMWIDKWPVWVLIVWYVDHSFNARIWNQQL